MDYKQIASELIEYLIKQEQRGRIIQRKLSEISQGEIAVLVFLLQKDGINACEISQYLEVNTSRVAAILNSLCKKGYIIRVADDKDKRKIRIYITNQGRELCIQKREETVLNLSKLLEKLGEDDALEYIRIMKKVSLIVEDLNID